VADWVEEQTEHVVEAGQDLWDDVKEVVSDLAEGASAVWSALEEVLQDIASGISGLVSEIEKKLEEILDDLDDDEETSGDDDLESGSFGPIDVSTLDRCPRGDDGVGHHRVPVRLHLDVEGSEERAEVGKGLTRDDKLDPTLTFHSEITQSLPQSEVKGAGKCVTSFSVGRSEYTERDDGTVDLFGVVLMTSQWNTNSHGLTDIVSAESPEIHAGNWVQVVEDLTPNSNGWPRRTRYWCEALSARHERFHAQDDKAKAMELVKSESGDLAGTYINPKGDLKRQSEKVMTKAVEDVSRGTQEWFEQGGEARAYAVGKLDYEALVEAIKARAKANGWPGTPQPPAPAAPPVGATPLTPIP
jgi:hypothetical protein